MRAHLFGHWYLAGISIQPWRCRYGRLCDWVLFFFTGVTVEPGAGVGGGLLFVSLALTYLLLRDRGPRWMALLAVTLAVIAISLLL